MISEAAVKRVNTYLCWDARARKHTWLLNIVVGSTILIFLRAQAVSDHVALPICGIVLLLVVTARAVTYQAKGLVINSSSRRVPNFKWDETRRGFLVGVPVMVIATVAALFLLPNVSEAEALHRRLKALVNEGDLSGAQALAHEAVRAGIPLKPDVLDLVGQKADRTSVDTVDVSEAASATNSSERHRIEVLVNNSEALVISSPVLYIPEGKYRFDGGINPESISVTADGPGETFLEPNFASDSGGVALFTFGSGMQADAILTSFTALPRDGSPLSSYIFLKTQSVAARVAVIDVELHSMRQSLDKVLWDTVTFTNCSVFCEGESLHLVAVRFVSCEFYFSANIPSFIVSKMRMSKGQAVTISWSSRRA